MSPAARVLFLGLVLAQAVHSVEEYVFRLWEVLAPARWVANALALDPALGFAVANTALAGFGLWCYAQRQVAADEVRDRRAGRPSLLNLVLADDEREPHELGGEPQNCPCRS